MPLIDAYHVGSFYYMGILCLKEHKVALDVDSQIQNLKGLVHIMNAQLEIKIIICHKKLHKKIGFMYSYCAHNGV